MALPSLKDFTSGIGQGWNTGQQMFDAGVAGLARAAGYQDVARDWERSADEQAIEAQRYANPATQVAPWREGGGGWGAAAPWLVNQAGQLVGGAAPLVAGGVVGAAAAPLVPEAIGGAALASGLGMGLASLPQSVGANYQAEREANLAQGLGEVTPEQAKSAAVWGVPSAALNAFAPTRAIGVGGKAAGAVSRTLLDAAKDVAKTGVDNALATAGQKAIEHSFRPDLSGADKTKDMLDSVVTGFLGGAGMGAAGEGVGRLIKAVRPDTPTADLDAYTKQVLEPEKAQADAVQEQGAESLYVRKPAEVGGGVPEGDAFGREVAAARQEGFGGQEAAQPLQEEVARQELSPPIDVPRQYLVEAERAAKSGSLDEKIAAAEQAGDEKRLSAFQRLKALMADERGSLRISSGMDEATDFEALMPKKEARVSEPQALHDMIQSEGGFYHTPDTRGMGEKLAPVGDVDEIVTRKGIKTVLHKAEPIERQVLAERPDITDKAERSALGLGGVDIHEMVRKAIEYHYLPEGSTPDDLVNALQGNERVYSAKDLDQARTFKAQQEAKEYDKVLKDNRKAIREQFPDEKPAVISRAAKLWADNPNEFAAEDAVRGARAEISGGPETEGFADSAFMEPAEGAPVEPKRAPTPKQYLVEAKKLWSERPEEFSDTVSLLEQSGDTARAEAYRAYQAEQLAKAPPIVRKVGGAEAKFVRTPKGIERVATPADAKQPVDRPAGTPPIDGPLGRAPAVPPLVPKETIPPKPADVMRGAGGGEPPKPPSGGGGEMPPEPPRKPIDVKAPKDIDSRLSRFLQDVDFGSLGDAARKLGLYVTTNHHHDEMYGKIMPSQLLYSKAAAFKAALSQRMQAHGMARQAELRDFMRRNDAIAKDTLALERAYQLGINPAKEWKEQSQRILGADKGTYEALHKQYQAIYKKLAAQDGGLDMHNSIREQYDTHWTSKPSAVLYTVLNDLADLPEELKSQIVDPSEALINNPDVARTPSQANKVFADALERNMEIAKAHLEAFPDKMGDTLGELVKEIESQKGKLKDVPYSALVRSGKYGIGFRLAVDKDGIINTEALARVQESIKKAGFDNVVVEPLANSDYVFIRSDNSTKVNNLKNLLVEHAKAGDIQEKDFEAGSMDVFSKSPAASKTINKLINQIENDDRYKPHEGDSDEMVKSREMRRKQMVSALRELSIDFLPEASMEKYSAHREYIPGFEGDPLQAMAKQSIENAQQVSGLLGTYRVQKALGEMLKEWEASKNPLDPRNQYEPIMAALYGRNMGKEEYAGIKTGGSLWDAAQSLNYSYYLGFNPSFGIIQMSQIPMYVIPELGKRYGFMKSATAIANSFAPSMKIIGAVLSEARKAGADSIADMPITIEALTKAGLDDDMARYMVHMVNRGGIDTGGLARSLGHIAENRTGGNFDRFTRWASAIGYYGETLSRIQTALASYEVFKNAKNKDGTPKYNLKNPEHWNKLINDAHNVLDEALFDYSQENRATGFSDDPRSLLGRGTKLAFAFQAYWMMAIEKQYREWHRLITDADPTAKKEAAKFILGHLGATALIAGSLGIPGMTVFQSAYEKVADDLHPEKGPHDFREEYTKWLEYALGPTLGDAVSYGAPRLGGMDWSKRTGEQDFAPLPTFLFDRGTWKDRFNKWALSKLGPAEGGVANWMASIDKFNAGDTWGAVTGLLPAAGFRNAATTIRAMQEGQYRDSKGHPIPNVPVTTEGAVSGFTGFTPKALAREREDNAMLHRYDTSIELDARNMVAPMVEALRNGDKAAFNRLLPAAKKFEKDHPGHDIIERAKKTYQKEYKDREKANKSGMPYERWSKDPYRKTLGLPSLRNQ